MSNPRVGRLTLGGGAFISEGGRRSRPEASGGRQGLGGGFAAPPPFFLEACPSCRALPIGAPWPAGFLRRRSSSPCPLEQIGDRLAQGPCWRTGGELVTGRGNGRLHRPGGSTPLCSVAGAAVNEVRHATARRSPISVRGKAFVEIGSRGGWDPGWRRAHAHAGRAGRARLEGAPGPASGPSPSSASMADVPLAGLEHQLQVLGVMEKTTQMPIIRPETAVPPRAYIQAGRLGLEAWAPWSGTRQAWPAARGSPALR